MTTTGRAILFGGSGFIGMHLARHLLARELATEVVLADIRRPRADLPAPLREAVARCRFVRVDVRQPIDDALVRGPFDLVVNLAAVHREPGHAAHEYFETNIHGAEHVCAFAAASGSNRLVFTSSISPYGPTALPKDERSLPTPTTAYGASKLVAEKIHLAWLGGDAARRLVIARPGVVFGPGEGGNVTRMVRAIRRGYFTFVGNRLVRKAAGYVKELCGALEWALRIVEGREDRHLLFNFSLAPPPSLGEMAEAIGRAHAIAPPTLSLPYLPILAASHAIANIAGRLGIEQPVDPVRVRKLVRSNHILPSVMLELGYPYAFTLDRALADWRADAPDEWR